jgi:hypothetical protein
MLLITDMSLPNVLGALVQPRSQAKESFFSLDPVSAVDAVGCHRPDRVAGETLHPGHLCSKLM